MSTANHNAQHEQDAYVEAQNPANVNQYRYDGAWRDMGVRKVIVRVKTATGVKAVNVTLRYTNHGPVISDPPAGTGGTQPPPPAGFAVSAMVSQFQQFRLATQIWQESEARSVAEFKQAMALNQLSSFNTLVADSSDSIFFVAASRSGILNPGVKPNSILHGANPVNDWQGILPFSGLPQAQNPASGYYQNANNAPWFTSPDQIPQSSVPFYLRGGGNTSRSRRQVQLLGSQTSLGPPTNLTLTDTERLGMDTFMEFAPSLRALLDQAAVGGDAKVQQAAALIDDWPGATDLNATRGATAYPLFATWKRGLNEGVLGFSTNNPPPPSTTFSTAQKNEARRAMIVAYDGMTAQYGTIAVAAGFLHTFTWGSFGAPVSGGDTGLETLRLTNCKTVPGSESPIYYHPCPVKGGSSNIFDVDLQTGRYTYSRPVSDTAAPPRPSTRSTRATTPPTATASSRSPTPRWRPTRPARACSRCPDRGLREVRAQGGGEVADRVADAREKPREQVSVVPHACVVPVLKRDSLLGRASREHARVFRQRIVAAGMEDDRRKALEARGDQRHARVRDVMVADEGARAGCPEAGVEDGFARRR